MADDEQQEFDDKNQTQNIKIVNEYETNLDILNSPSKNSLECDTNIYEKNTNLV